MAELREDIQIGIGSGRARKGASAIRRALDSIRRKSKQVHDAGARDAKKHGRALGLLAKATAAISGFIIARSAIKSQIEFGQAVSDLSAITGATGKDLDFLRQKSKEFGAQTTLTATEAATAFKIIASAKPDLLTNVEALSLVTEEAIALAEATGDNLPTAANVMASALNQFGANADDASRFINVLAAGSKFGAAMVGEMGEALKSVGVIASQAGIGFEETNAALQLMSTRAIKGGEAGMQFRGVLLALTAQSKDEFKPEVVGLQKALENLSIAGLDQGSESVKLFGRRNLAVAKTLIQNREQLGELTKKLTGTNIAYEQQSIRVDNLSGDIKALKSAYEGLELTVGEKLNGALRAMTQSATDSIRALAANPLLQKGVTAVLDAIHRIFQDIGLAIDQITDAFDKNAIGADVWMGALQAGIQNIIKWTKFLWDQFIIGGPANLKLGFTLMIGAADLFRIMLVEKIRTAVFLMIDSFISFQKSFTATIKIGVQVVIRTFTEMAQAVGRTFDNLKLTIAGVIDSLILQVAEKVKGIADTLESLGFEERASEIRNVAEAIGGLATNEEQSRKQLEANEVKRRAEIKAIEDTIQAIKDKRDEELSASREITDDLIKDTEEVAAVQRKAALDATELAIMERDATLEQIKALRTKRQEIIDGQVAAAAGGPDVIAEVAIVGEKAYEDLGDTQKKIVDGMSQGLSDMAAEGKLDFKSLALSIIQDLIRIQLQTLLTQIFTQILGGLGGGGGTPVPIPTGGVGAGGASFVPSPIINAEHGIKFKVGGSGGVDSQRIQLNATPGEEVVVRTRQDIRERDEFLEAFLDGQAAADSMRRQRERDGVLKEFLDGKAAADSMRPRSDQDQALEEFLDRQAGASTRPQREREERRFERRDDIRRSSRDEVFLNSFDEETMPMTRREQLGQDESFKGFLNSVMDGMPTIRGFAQGGSFKIGGSGGPDSQVAIIKASPDETISIRTPQQQKTDTNERGREKVKVQFTVNNFTDAKVEAKQSQDTDGNVLIQASISAVSRDITRNGQVFQSMRARQSLRRR